MHTCFGGIAATSSLPEKFYFFWSRNYVYLCILVHFLKKICTDLAECDYMGALHQ